MKHKATVLYVSHLPAYWETSTTDATFLYVKRDKGAVTCLSRLE